MITRLFVSKSFRLCVVSEGRDQGETVVSANKLAVPVASPFFFFKYIYFVSETEHGLSSGMLMNDALFRLIMYMKESISIFVHVV